MFSYWNAMDVDTRHAIRRASEGMAAGSVFVSTRCGLNDEGYTSPTWVTVATSWFDFERIHDETVVLCVKM